MTEYDPWPPLSAEEIALLCSADGVWEDTYGGEHGWACGNEAVASLAASREQVCEFHLEEELDGIDWEDNEMPGKGRGKGHEEKKKQENREDKVVERVVKDDEPVHSGRIGKSPGEQAGGTGKPGKG